MEDTETVRAPAKINLRLVILAREEAGYHQIETLFAALELADTVRATRGEPGIRLVVSGADPGPPELNLAWRAAVAFFEAARIPAAIDLALEKCIPVGAGLGGGSSDAAATLLALNALHGRPLGAAALRGLAVALGADVPFFLARAPYVLGWGRGERLLRLRPPPDAPVLLVVPPTPVSTADAYRELAEYRLHEPASPPESLPATERLATWRGIAACARNDFEGVVGRRIPEIRAALEVLRARGARIARLSGSGSAVFGVFRDERRLEAAQSEVLSSIRGVHTIVTRTAFGGGRSAR